MKHLVLVTMILGANTMAYADGFRCESRDGKLSVKVFNHVMAEDGTRNGAVMVVSDNDVQLGRKTIARFTDTKSTLSNSGALYEAKVDLRVSGSSRKGELIGGTKLGELKTLVLEIDFKYNRPIEDGEVVDGVLTLNKRNGEVAADLDLDCTRYLKN